MFNTIKKGFIVSVLISSGVLSSGFLSGRAAIASESKSESIFGLPNSVTGTTEQANSNSTTVGSLPYSNQWISEKTGSFFYFSYNSAQLSDQKLFIGQYVSDFGSAEYTFPALDFFSHLISLAGPESRSPARDLAIWGRYSLGLANRSGNLSSTQTQFNSAVENNSLLIINARVGALLGFDRWRWIKPYAGIEIDPYFFRNTADISGAEQQGESFCFAPVLGAHFPILFNGHASFLAEFRRTLSVQDSGQIFGSSNNYSAGMGLTF